MLLAAGLKKSYVVYSIDLERYDKRDTVVRKVPSEIIEQIEFIIGNANKVVKKWDKMLGMIFFDGKHTKKALTKDTKNWCPFIQPGGFAAFHDVATYKWRRKKLGVQELNDVLDVLKRKGWKELDVVDSLVILQKPS